MHARWLALVALFAPFAAPAAAPEFAPLVREHAAAVVSIRAAYATPPVLPDLPHDDALGDLLERLGAGFAADFDLPALGSGFIVSEDGYILTARHIVEEALDEEVVVRLADGRELPGRVLGADRATDIGLVKIEARALPRVRIGDPARLQPGDWVFTMGTPFGFERSVAAGIVSTTARALPSETHILFIQSDVAMNPGHSGGPLFNLDGEVVGVNSIIFSYTGGSIGLSFAVPIDAAMSVAHELRAHGKVVRGRIGVQLQELTPELARALRLAEPVGALVTATERGGPAERAGLRAGDVVRRFGAERVATHVELLARAAATAPGTVVRVELVRGGKRLALSVQVVGDEPERRPYAARTETDRFGLRLAPLSPAERRRRGAQGALLVQRAEGAARRSGLFPGDIIVSVNGRTPGSPEAFQAALAEMPPGEPLALLVERGGRRAFVPLRLP